MSAFINNDITTAGLLVMAKGISGQEIKYTKIVLGDGYLQKGQTPRTLERVISPCATVDISKVVINGNGTVTVGGIFTNENTDEFYYRELGLYAEDPDPAVGEVLYCYGNCGDFAELIPQSGGSTVIEKTINIITSIGTATNVTAYINPDAYATVQQYENYKKIAMAAQNDANAAKALAELAIDTANSAKKQSENAEANITLLQAKISTLWDAVFGQITTNPFSITFDTLEGFTLTSGVWNTSLNRLEC